MTFEKWLKQRHEDCYSVKAWAKNIMREAWIISRRTDPVKQQLYEALQESVETYEDWFDDGEQCEYIQRSKRAIKAYEEEQDDL